MRKYFVWILIAIALINGATAVYPTLDNTSNHYDLTTINGVTFNYSDNSWIGGPGYLLATALNVPVTNFTIYMEVKQGSTDFDNKASQGLFQIRNGSNIRIAAAYIISNSSAGSYGRIGLDHLNGSGITDFGQSAGINKLKNMTDWTAITIVYNTSTIAIYTNGTLAGTVTATGGLYNGTITKLYLMDANGPGFNGSIRNVKVFNRTLNASEVNQTYNNISLSGMFAYYSMNNNCTVPVDNMTVNWDNGILNFCSGQLYNLQTGSVTLNGTNMTLECNYSQIYTTDVANDNLSGIVINKGSNSRIQHCNVTGYSAGIFVSNYGQSSSLGTLTNISINNNTLRGNGGVAAIFLDGVSKSTIEYNDIRDLGNNGQGSIGSHCIYWSADGNGVIQQNDSIIRYNTCINSSASGFKFNCANSTHSNFSVYGNFINYLHLIPANVTSTDAFGLALFGATNTSIYNNTINDTDVAILIGQCIGGNLSINSFNNSIVNNTLTNSYGTDNRMFYARNGTFFTHLFYNNFGGVLGSIHTDLNTSFDYYDTSAELRIDDKSANRLVDFNYTGYKNFTVYNNGTVQVINISNQNLAAPYRDVRLFGVNYALQITNAQYNMTPYLFATAGIYISNFLNGGSIYGPNIISIWEINTEDYFDREIKNYFGAIEALPDMTNNFAAHTMITPTLPNLTVNVTFPLANQMNAYVNGMSNGTAIDYATVHLYYTSIYGGRIGEVASYNCTVQ